jgi:hypothetical protein
VLTFKRRFGSDLPPHGTSEDDLGTGGGYFRCILPGLRSPCLRREDIEVGSPVMVTLITVPFLFPVLPLILGCPPGAPAPGICRAMQRLQVGLLHITCHTLRGAIDQPDPRERSPGSGTIAAPPWLTQDGGSPTPPHDAPAATGGTKEVQQSASARVNARVRPKAFLSFEIDRISRPPPDPVPLSTFPSCQAWGRPSRAHDWTERLRTGHQTHPVSEGPAREDHRWGRPNPMQLYQFPGRSMHS